MVQIRKPGASIANLEESINDFVDKKDSLMEFQKSSMHEMYQVEHQESQMMHKQSMYNNGKPIIDEFKKTISNSPSDDLLNSQKGQGLIQLMNSMSVDEQRTFNRDVENYRLNGSES